MKASMKTAVSGILAALALASFEADAGGNIRVVNLSNTQVHPWFRSNCFSPPTAAGTWIFFGGINAYGSFEWEFASGLIDPACKKPKVEFTYTVDGMLPPLPDLPDDLVGRINWSPTADVAGFYVMQAVVGTADRKKNDD